jgi:hypothetical protein
MYGLGIYRYPIPIPSAPLEQRSHRANAARWAAALLESEFPGTLEDCLGDELVPKSEVEFEFDPTAIDRAGVDDDGRSRAGVDDDGRAGVDDDGRAAHALMDPARRGDGCSVARRGDGCSVARRGDGFSSAPAPKVVVLSPKSRREWMRACSAPVQPSPSSVDREHVQRVRVGMPSFADLEFVVRSSWLFEFLIVWRCAKPWGRHGASRGLAVESTIKRRCGRRGPTDDVSGRGHAARLLGRAGGGGARVARVRSLR